jgi:hypothetical protein
MLESANRSGKALSLRHGEYPSTAIEVIVKVVMKRENGHVQAKKFLIMISN